MPLTLKKENYSIESQTEFLNVYAYNVSWQEIHISEAESGRKGYYCLGCKREMQAVKPKVANIIPYFRHDPKAVKTGGKCTYSDETYRHKLAKERLQLLKQIKVPAVYKYPSKGQDGLANLLREARIVEAAFVGIEVTFYEDQDGNICWGSNKDIEERFLTIKPDVTFFDADKKPILFIELVATHSITVDKLIKLKRLGIDTVQVKVPKDSPESISNCFLNTERTKWVYNYEQECTAYISIPAGNTEGISPFDEEQRKLFDETFECKQAQINSLIRTIRRCLESKQYRDIELAIGDELSRVEGNTEGNRTRLGSIRKECRERVRKRFENQITELELASERTEAEEIDFEQKSRDLEKRYQSKKSEIDTEQADVDREIEGETEDDGGTGNRIENRRKAIGRDIKRITEFIRKEEREINSIEQEEDVVEDENREIEKRAIEGFEQSEQNIKAKIRGVERDKNQEPDRHRFEKESLPGEFRSKEAELEREFEELREQALQIIVSRNGKGNSDLHTRIRRLLAARERLNDLEQITRDYRRNRKAWECFKTGAFEKWT